ncbi:MAG: hypothetical protein CFE43_15585 [Burkholderiales bacterium PBB3]|nr:MAG: hypothetical protein CFE43_15585 [Burkholderiales bacterium PBB3]
MQPDSTDDIQRNLLRVLAVTSGSWNLVATSRFGRRLAYRGPVHVPRRLPTRPVYRIYPALQWAW